MRKRYDPSMTNSRRLRLRWVVSTAAPKAVALLYILACGAGEGGLFVRAIQETTLRRR